MEDELTWEKVYAQVNRINVEMMSNNGPIEVPCVSFRMIAEVDGHAYLATHLMLASDYDDMDPAINVYSHVLDDMVHNIDQQAGAFA